SRRRHTRWPRDWSSDVCSSDLVHPLAPLAHPLDDGTAPLLERSVDATADGLGPDAAAYRRLFGPLAAAAHDLFGDLLGPFRLPRSEERRVGKECRSRWVQEDEK